MAPRHLDDVPEPARLPESPHDAADREWLTLLTGTADGALTTTAIPAVPTAPMPVMPVQRQPEPPPADRAWLQVESIRGARPDRPPRRPFPAVLAAVAGLILGVAASEPFRALAAVLTDLARDLTGGA